MKLPVNTNLPSSSKSVLTICNWGNWPGGDVLSQADRPDQGLEGSGWEERLFARWTPRVVVVSHSDGQRWPGWLMRCAAVFCVAAVCLAGLWDGFWWRRGKRIHWVVVHSSFGRSSLNIIVSYTSGFCPPSSVCLSSLTLLDIHRDHKDY